MLPKVMTPKGLESATVSIEEALLYLNRFQLTSFKGDDIFRYCMVINLVSLSGPFL